MKIKFIFIFTFIFICFGVFSNVRAQSDNIANQPAIMKQDCKNYLGRPMQSLCTSETAYTACVNYLKQGKWDYCVFTGDEKKRAKRATNDEAKQTLIKKNCKEISANTFQCPDTDYALSTAYLDCLAFQYGTATVRCADPLDLLTIYADKIEAQLKGKPVGYAFVITNDKGKTIERAWGSARKSPDSPNLAMSVNSKYTMASVSKNITAAAVLKVLAQKNIPVTERIYKYLPKDWKLSNGIADITFEQLLKHRSGIRCDFGNVGYADTKTCLEKGVNTNSKNADCGNKWISDSQAIGCYNNYNYALFRILIPRVNGFSADNSTDPATEYAYQYLNYVNKEIFAKAQTKALCKPSDGNQQPLSYKLSAPNGKGEIFGDMSLYCGSQGWFLNAVTLSRYFSLLNRTDEIVSKQISQQMRENLYGYTNQAEFNTKYGKILRWWHGGYHPASMNDGEINTLVMRFSNGIQIAFIMNSDLPVGMNYGDVLTNSMYEALNQ